MTVIEKARQIVNNGLKEKEIFKFFDVLQKDVIEYVELFGSLGINQNSVWELYENWQES